MDDGVSVELVHGGDDALLEFLFGCDSNVAQHGACELGEEALDQIEPGAVLWDEDEGPIGRRARPWFPWTRAPSGCRG